MGEINLPRQVAGRVPSTTVGVQTAGGRVNVRWDANSAATPMGQLAFFIEFLTINGLWQRWLDTCPLRYTSPNAPDNTDVLGTWLLSILSGHRRYSHVTAIRCDGVNPGLLGMSRVISEDALRRALKAIDAKEGTAWLDDQIRHSTEPLLDVPWVLDIDTTIKPLYGHQQGAKVSYNPHKPGRPSHSYHTYLMAGLRLVLGMEVKAGDQHASNHSLPGLLELLDGLPPAKRPRIVRGDCAFGADPTMRALEERGQSYLFKLRLSTNVKRLIERVLAQPGWSDAGQGWEGLDSDLGLLGWQRARRVVVIRRALHGDLAVSRGDARQQSLGFFEPERDKGKRIRGYEYAVLVTNLDYEVLTLAQLYRDRADAENTFDELKNQWGWGGFTTQDLHRCRLSARAVALVYNWWSLYVRLANPQQRREAITSRPWLMTSVGRRTEHAGQTIITLTGMHAEFARAREALVRVSAMLKTWLKSAAEQLDGISVWHRCCSYLKRILVGIQAPQKIPGLTFESG